MLQLSWTDRGQAANAAASTAALDARRGLLARRPAFAADPWLVFEGADGPGKGKHVVLVSGDEEYRSEEALPQLAKILATASWLQVHGALRHRQGRHDRPEPERQYPRPRVASIGRPDDHRHPLPQPAGRPDEGRRRLRRVGPPDHRHAHGDARLQPEQARPTRSTRGTARSGTAASAGRCSARPGSTTTATTARRARAASSHPGRRTTRSFAASRTATSGARPTSTKRTRPPTARRWCSARCSRA